MKKILRRNLAAAAIFAFAASSALATTVSVNDRVKLADGPGASPGGAFILSNMGPTGTSVLGTFETFCLEFNEYIRFGTTYVVRSISDRAVAGGAGGSVGGSDPLDFRTAFLYTNYRENPSGLNGAAGWAGATAEQRGTALQQAIWVIEQEIASTSNALAGQLIALATNSGWNSIGRVRVLNLEDLQGNRAQDQLYLAPVPLPAAAWLFISAIGGLVLVGRRRRMHAARA